MPLLGADGLYVGAAAAEKAYLGAEEVWSAVPAFSPTDIAGLILWLKADVLSLADAAGVASWTDSSGLNNHAVQATGGLQPTYRTSVINGKPVVRFDGSDDILISPASAANRPCTVIVVHKPTNFTAPRAMVGAPVGSFGFPINTAGKQTLESAGSALLATGTATLTAGVAVMSEVTYALSGAWAFYLDGTADGSGTNVTVFGANSTQIGQSTGSGQKYLGDIAEVLKYDTVLSTEDRQAVEAYLGAKYGIA